MVGGEAAAAVEELVSGVRQATDFAEQFRSYSESEKQWKARMEFILRHLPDYRDPPDGGGRLDQLLSLSMVWANHLFLGCSYNKDLLDKVMEMADGIEVEDLPQFTTRSELMKKVLNVGQNVKNAYFFFNVDVIMAGSEFYTLDFSTTYLHV
ncbi:CDKN2AIP N-terminal-like protein isoform X1 [Kogia breviceps]|uniref:CDKN2AIP N-terminal-like protein isoform X1 n=1 Tax=Kogia breviceps TaxID=27615 RepID=UPI002796380F|nr:CDKN2AIP N-terminal-like protein isoform X1 [Kogia breviceps]